MWLHSHEGGLSRTFPASPQLNTVANLKVALNWELWCPVVALLNSHNIAPFSVLDVGKPNTSQEGKEIIKPRLTVFCCFFF